jgi:hypothetical protein
MGVRGRPAVERGSGIQRVRDDDWGERVVRDEYGHWHVALERA